MLKKPAKPTFQRVSGKNKTKKNFSKKFFLGGALFFGGLEKQNLRPPPPINNEPSLREASLFMGWGRFYFQNIILAPRNLK